jgi:predicted nucleic acid-binding protein
MSAEDSGANPPAFVDTNILAYALAADDDARAAVAQDLLRRLMAARTLRLSTQILQELFVTLTRKVQKPLASGQAIRYMDQLAVFPVFSPDYPAVRDAAELSASARLSFWDSLVVVSAARVGATRLYSEDFNQGQTIVGVEVVNPFSRNTGKR